MGERGSDKILSGLYQRALLSDDESGIIYTSPVHLAIGMRLAFHGRSSLSELCSYLGREGLRATEEEIIGVLREYELHGYVVGNDEGYHAQKSLVGLVTKRAPSRAYLESKARPQVI